MGRVIQAQGKTNTQALRQWSGWLVKGTARKPVQLQWSDQWGAWQMLPEKEAEAIHKNPETQRTLDFMLCKVDSHWRIFRKEMTWSYLDFKRNILPDVSGIDCSRARESAEGWVRGAELWGSMATWCEELTHQKRPWCWETLRVGGEKSDRGWDGWMASSTQWAGVWANSGRWWRTGNPGVLPSMGLQRVRHYWVTQQQQQIPELTAAWSGEAAVDLRRSNWVWKCIFQERGSRFQWWFWYKFYRSGFPATCTDHPKYSYLHLAILPFSWREPITNLWDSFPQNMTLSLGSERKRKYRLTGGMVATFLSHGTWEKEILGADLKILFYAQ